MENPTLLTLLSPWLELLLILVPMFYTERWLHQHFFGIGYILTRKNGLAATRIFYLFFLPGIFLHEFIQYLMAGALNVPIKKVLGWPEKQENGTLRLNFIVVEREKTDLIRASLVAAAPFLIMSALVWYISTQQLGLYQVTDTFGSGDLQTITTTARDTFTQANFSLWAYLLFVIANSMIPKREDAQGIPVLLGVVGVISVVMIIVGLDQVLLDTYSKNVVGTLNRINTALISVLLLNCLAIGLLWLAEWGVERLTGEKMVYHTDPPHATEIRKENKRIPGSDGPYPKGERLPSFYNLTLQLPSADESPRKKAAPQPRVREPERTLPNQEEKPLARSTGLFSAPEIPSGERPAFRPAPRPSTPLTEEKPAETSKDEVQYVGFDEEAPPASED